MIFVGRKLKLCVTMRSRASSFIIPVPYMFTFTYSGCSDIDGVRQLNWNAAAETSLHQRLGGPTHRKRPVANHFLGDLPAKRVAISASPVIRINDDFKAGESCVTLFEVRINVDTLNV